MNLLTKITKYENDENVPHLEITEVVLVHYNVLIMINKIQECCINLFLINHLVNYQIFDPRILYF